jgi:hypothetical protein
VRKAILQRLNPKDFRESMALATLHAARPFL